MGQKAHPIGLRVGIIYPTSSRWFAGKKEDYARKIGEDEAVRKFVAKNLANASVAATEIERKGESIKITLFTSKPGILVGKSGANIKSIKDQLKKLLKKEVEVDISEVGAPDLNSKLIGKSIAEQLEKRSPYRRSMKMAMQKAIEGGAQGIKIQISGRLNGAEIARTEWAREGRVPLQTLRADIDFAHTEANTIFGKIGIKVWVYKGQKALLANSIQEATNKQEI
jgi:small subunit ribosomal protein S3